MLISTNDLENLGKFYAYLKRFDSETLGEHCSLGYGFEVPSEDYHIFFHIECYHIRGINQYKALEELNNVSQRLTLLANEMGHNIYFVESVQTVSKSVMQLKFRAF